MRAIIHHRRRSSVLPQAIRGRSVAVAVRWMVGSLGWAFLLRGHEGDRYKSWTKKRAKPRNERTKERIAPGREGWRTDKKTRRMNGVHVVTLACLARGILVGSSAARNCPIISWVDWRSRRAGPPISKNGLPSLTKRRRNARLTVQMLLYGNMN